MENEDILTIMKMFKEMKLSRLQYENDDQKILIEQNMSQALFKNNEVNVEENIIEIKSPTVGKISIENHV